MICLPNRVDGMKYIPMTKKGKEVSNNLVQVGNISIAKHSSTLVQRGLALYDSTITFEKIRLLIVDDVSGWRYTIRQFIAAAENILVVGEASNGLEAVEMYDELKPDVVSMNINMPIMNGIAATELICKKHNDANIFIFSVQGDPEYMRRAKNAGALDYLLKGRSEREIINTIYKLAGRPNPEIESNQEAA